MDKFQIKAYLVRNLKDIQLKLVFVDDKNYILVRKRLELERRRAIKVLQDLKEQGKIKSISKPKNFTIQKELNNLMVAKNHINNSILKIKEIYYIV